jgi:hypothetical protein
MELAILLSLAASVCTATSSVCQRLGARHLERCGDWSAYVLMGVGTGAMLLTSHTTQPRRPEAGEATNRELTGRSR